MILRSLLPLTLLLAAAQVRAQGAPSASQPPESPPTATSRAAELEALKKELKELRARIEGEGATRGDVQGVQADLENFKYQYQRDRETKSALSTRNLLISGIVQARGAYYGAYINSPVNKAVAATSVNNPALLDDRKTTFDIPQAILAFNGLLYRDYEQARNLGFTLSAAATPVAGALNAYLGVLDANLTYQLLPTIENDGPRLSLTLGQQLVPFGLESNTNEEFKPVINNAQFVGQAGLGARQIGLVARGEFFTQFDFGYAYRQALLAFALGIVNGTGPNRDDDNAFKDVVARVALTLPAEYDSWLRELRIGASAYLGRASLGNGAVAPATAALVATGLKNRFGVDVYYNHFPLGFTYEAVRSVDDVWDSASAAEVRHNGFGQTATAFYSFGQQFLKSIKTQGKFDDWWPKTWQPFVRYDRWAADLGKQGAANEIYTGGLNVFFAETTKAQINVNRRLQHVVGADNVASTELLAQVQFGF
ncbi:MAG: porin [Anaeromyxobacteraceae bacterium]